MYNRYEIIMLYLIGFYLWFREKYVKYFPALALAFSLFYGYGLVGGVEKGTLKAEHLPIVFTTTLIFTVFVLIYFIFRLNDRVKSRRPRHSERDRRTAK